MKVLFVSSEVYPLNKTGGLGDIAYSLPHALYDRSIDVRLILPAYRDVMDKIHSFQSLGRLNIRGYNKTHSVRLLEAKHPDFNVVIYLADCQSLFDRPGNPYLQENGEDWPDNAERFTVFARAAEQLALNQLQNDWQPDVIHCNDWQSGLVPALLSERQTRPKTVFTIHNLAYGGHFSKFDYVNLQLPDQLWNIEGAEFYGGFSMLKSGIVFSDYVTTVSPTYAEEICTPDYGYAMDGVLRSRREKLYGILNGIDEKHWDPSTDPNLPLNYSSTNVSEGKRAAKKALLDSFQIDRITDESLEPPLLGMVGRLVEQKGIDLILDIMPTILAETNACFVFLGTGDDIFVKRLAQAAQEYPARVYVEIGFSEEKAHLLEAGSDIFLMPSRFEPCGLNQMYSLRYGTPPVVHNTGGLADTVIRTDAETLANNTANGFVFEQANAELFLEAVTHSLNHFADKKKWADIIRNGMSLDLGWDNRARQYLELYND